MDIGNEIDARGRTVLIIGDTHLPYEHCDYLAFIKYVHSKLNNPIVVHIGDEVDNHSISFHDSDQELFSAGHELEVAIDHLQHWHEAFPNMVLLESNHGSLVVRKFKHHGVPIKYLKPLQEIYGTPNWTWWHDILLKTNIGDVYLCHGKSSRYGALAKEQGCSAIQGHFHGKLEVTWHQRVNHRRFNMFVGCGVNWNSLAMAYGKNNIPKPIHGCGVLDADGYPYIFHMRLDKNGRWVGE